MYDLNLATCAPPEGLERTVKQAMLFSIREKLGPFDLLPANTDTRYGVSFRTLTNVYSAYAEDQFSLIQVIGLLVKFGLPVRLLFGEE